jgi:hypothetical protein
MAAVRDFRKARFSQPRIENCAAALGNDSYTKLYVVENVFRVVIHSVLTAEIGPNWPANALTPKMQNEVARFRPRYAGRPRHASPGNHELYYLFLADLAVILRSQRARFDPHIRDVDRWLLRLESVNLPRNLIGHMNVPNSYDRSRVTQAFQALPKLLMQLRGANIPFLVPS